MHKHILLLLLALPMFALTGVRVELKTSPDLHVGGDVALFDQYFFVGVGASEVRDNKDYLLHVYKSTVRDFYVGYDVGFRASNSTGVGYIFGVNRPCVTLGMSGSVYWRFVDLQLSAVTASYVIDEVINNITVFYMGLAFEFF